MKIRTFNLTASALVMGLVLAACGGGDDNHTSSSSSSSSAATTSSSSSAATTSSSSSSAAVSSSSSAASTSSSSSAATSSAASSSVSSSSTSSAASPQTTTWTPAKASFDAVSALASCVSGNYPFNITASAITVDGLQFYSSGAGSLRLNDSTSDCTGTTTFGVNYNGTSFAASADQSTVWSAGQTVDLTPSTSISRYVAVPYASTATATPSLTVTFTNSSSTCTNSQVVITNAAGKVLKVASACVSSTQTTLTASDAVSVGSSGSFYVLFTRAGDSGGGIRLWKTELTH